MTRRRLSPDERRTQLLDLGQELFASAPYDEVHIERVAELAGVSRGLLYHYFPTKRSFFAALVRRGTAALALATETSPDQPPMQQLVLGVERYLEHVREHPHATRAFHRGIASGDVEVQAVVADSTRLFEDRVLDAIEPDREPHPLLGIAVRTWVVLVRAAGQELLDQPEVTVAQVRDLCVGALVALVAALPDEARPARADELLGG